MLIFSSHVKVSYSFFTESTVKFPRQTTSPVLRNREYFGLTAP